MAYSEFWTFIQSDPKRPVVCPVMPLPSVSIVELTEDGMAFIWPVRANYDALCEVCRTYLATPEYVFRSSVFRAEHCQAEHPAEYPCNFQASEHIDHQDLDAFLADGDSMEAGGYFKGINDFLSCCQVSDGAFQILTLGRQPGVHAAREALAVLKSRL